MTAELAGPVAVIDEGGHLTVDTEERPEDGRLTLRFHPRTMQAVAFLFRALRASRELRVISMVPIRGDNTEVVLDLNTPDRAVSFLIQLRLVFATAEERAVAAR